MSLTKWPVSVLDNIIWHRKKLKFPHSAFTFNCRFNSPDNTSKIIQIYVNGTLNLSNI